MTVVTACEAFRYELPLIGELRAGGDRLRSRTGVIVRLTDERGCQGFGEAAPWPSLHREDVAAVVTQLRTLAGELPGVVVNAPAGRLTPRVLYPSLHYALDMAALELLAATRSTTPVGLLAPGHPRRLAVNGLVTEAGDVRSQVERLRAEGYTTIKLKVGRRPAAEEIRRVHAARVAFGATGALRLDANCAWTLAEAVAFGQAVAACGIEYIEEPLADSAGLAEFHAATGMATALDESLQSSEPAASALPAGVAALVLKPAVLGGLAVTLAFIRLAAAHRLQCVITSVFESGVGLAALAGLAAAAGGDSPHGLDTGRWLGADLLEDPFAAHGGHIDVNAVYRQSRRLRWERLERVI